MLKKVRIVMAAVCFTLITLLFLDFTGTLHTWFGVLARAQLLPAVVALNLGAVAAVLLLTMLCGRVYCSVLCPLGVLQDVVSWLAGRFRHSRFRHTPAHNRLRYAVLALFIISAVAGLGIIPVLLEPYSAYGRIASALLAPLWKLGNNLLAFFAERVHSYAIYSTAIWMRGLAPLAIAVVTLALLTPLAWRRGRLWCNTFCPVGAVLGLLSRLALFRPRVDADRCTGCGVCARQCKAECFDAAHGRIDASRCVACMNCVAVCPQQAVALAPIGWSRPREDTVDPARRNFIATAALAALTAPALATPAIAAPVAALTRKQRSRRQEPVTPPGSQSRANFAAHCTACQLCVSSCPNQVLHASGSGPAQPVMEFEHGFCRANCNTCSSVCPTGAIRPITLAKKSATQVGYAVWTASACVVTTDQISCDTCARRCPANAIVMTAKDADDPKSLKFPAVDTERCIGCGACEYFCPARPFSAIHVEGNVNHRRV